MKKALVLVLALVLTMGLAVPAAAATSSPKAATASPSATAPLPTVVGDAKVTVVATTDASLTADEKTALASAQAALAAATPAEMKAQYFFYVKAEGTVTLTVKVDAADVTVMQFVDGKWTELKSTVADGTVTIEGVVTGPMAIFTK